MCWEEIGLWSRINDEILECDSFIALCFKLLSSLDSKQYANFAMCIWSIWRWRNDKYWENKDVSSSAVIHRASTFYNEWIHYLVRVAPSNPYLHDYHCIPSYFASSIINEMISAYLCPKKKNLKYYDGSDYNELLT